ncbi:ECF transporter S component [candidate division KSB1 bacterium]|jgi:hypothetical protein|nr:ECF transporter S component [candidate division KSB1 bacterium]
MQYLTRKITTSAMFIALGVLVPLVFHGLGMGSILLPMFWPVAMGAFFLPFGYALAVGLLTPVLSTLFTGMPPISPPILHVIMIELAALSVTIVILKKTKLGVFWILLFALLVSRTFQMIAIYFLLPLFGLPQFLTFAAVLKGGPGIVIMLIMIPFFMHRLKDAEIFTFHPLSRS